MSSHSIPGARHNVLALMCISFHLQESIKVSRDDPDSIDFLSVGDDALEPDENPELPVDNKSDTDVPSEDGVSESDCPSLFESRLFYFCKS